MLRPCNIAPFALITALLVAPRLVASSFTFTTIDFPGSPSSDAFKINDSGQIVGFTGDGHGYLLSGGIFTTIAPPPTTHSGSIIADR